MKLDRYLREKILKYRKIRDVIEDMEGQMSKNLRNFEGSILCDALRDRFAPQFAYLISQYDETDQEVILKVVKECCRNHIILPDNFNEEEYLEEYLEEFDWIEIPERLLVKCRNRNRGRSFVKIINLGKLLWSRHQIVLFHNYGCYCCMGGSLISCLKGSKWPTTTYPEYNPGSFNGIMGWTVRSYLVFSENGGTTIQTVWAQEDKEFIKEYRGMVDGILKELEIGSGDWKNYGHDIDYLEIDFGDEYLLPNLLPSDFDE